MATRLVPFMDVRAAIAVARREGERLAGGIMRDVRALVARSRADIASDMRRLRRDVQTRADAAVKDLEARGAKVVGVFERELGNATEGILKRFSAPTQSEIAALSRRVAVLEQQLGAAERAARRRQRRKRAASSA